MEVVFLGTSCMVPTKERNHQAIFISLKKNGLLFDCGEGTQRQLKIAKIKATRINKIFITHWHGDHVFGLPGLLQTLNSSKYEKTLEIYGPEKTKELIELMFKTFFIKPNFSFIIKEIKKDSVLVFEEFTISAKYLKHSLPCLGYSIKERDKRKMKLSKIKKLGIPQGPLLGKLQNNKTIILNGQKIHPEEVTYVVRGKKVSIILDTLPCENAMLLAKGSDLLICEAVYGHKLINKAEEYMHLTAKQAAQIASNTDTKKLIITHFSQRYKTNDELLEEAKTFFKNTLASYDLMKIKV